MNMSLAMLHGIVVFHSLISLCQIFKCWFAWNPIL